MGILDEIKDLSTGQLLERGSDSVPDKIAIVDGERRITYKELNDRVDHFAAALSQIGFVKGDSVAIYMANSLELVTAFYALQKLGVIAVWINPGYRKADARFILENSESKSVIIAKEWDGFNYLEAISSIKKELPSLESVIVTGSGEAEGIFEFDALLKKGSKMTHRPAEIDIKNDLSMLLYTSGTTGSPKGAMCSHYAAVRGGWTYSFGIGATSEDIFIGFLPMYHSYGCGSILIEPLLLQSTLVIMDKFEPERVFQIIEREKITLQLGAPAHYIIELNNKKRKNYDLSSLRAGLIAGQIAPEGLITRVEKEMDVYLTSFWGASEVGPGLGIICPYPSTLEIREQYVGKPIPETKVRIVDPQTQEELPDGEIGELTLSGWHLMQGYWKNPEETKKQVIDGWLFMGDLVSREKEGYLKIYGRTKDLINRGGFKIYPSELEGLIVDHPKVEQVCMVATSNPVLGENICACVVPVDKETISLEEIREFLKDKIAPHKLPDELSIMEDFPRLSGGVKINKFGKGGLTELAQNDESREKYRK